MATWDVFNGDADGLCALHQLRLAEERPKATLITGVKRDIRLLRKLTDCHGDQITVLDISLDRNRTDLEQLLRQGNRVCYLDHHFCGDLPQSPLLEAHIDPASETCTALIADQLLQGKFGQWAIIGAFGDNLDTAARQKGKELQLEETTMQRLREIGILLNYNSYGESVADLHYNPRDLYHRLHRFTEPETLWEQADFIDELRQGLHDDLQRAQSIPPIQQDLCGRVFRLPATAWSRRIVGIFANMLVRQQPDLAHAVLVERADASLQVSVRAPLHNRQGADVFCRRYPGGGGRAAAAGINRLPSDNLAVFLDDFTSFFMNN